MMTTEQAMLDELTLNGIERRHFLERQKAVGTVSAAMIGISESRLVTYRAAVVWFGQKTGLTYSGKDC